MVRRWCDDDANDAGAITDKLGSDKVNYKLTDGGRTVLVPQSQVYQLRVDLSSKGLPAATLALFVPTEDEELLGELSAQETLDLDGAPIGVTTIAIAAA